METIEVVEQAGNLKNNVILQKNGKLALQKSKISFSGINNILLIEGDMNLVNSNINFRGNDSIVYIRKTANGKLSLSVDIYNQSTIFINRNSYFNGTIKMIVSESKNLFIGCDCIFSFGIWMRNSDAHGIYSLNDGFRINNSKSIFIGDHVWLSQDVSILKGSSVGSGSVIGLGSIVSRKILSNSIYAGNPANLVKDKIFWDSKSVHSFTPSQINSELKISNYNNEKNDYSILEDTSEDWLRFDLLLNNYPCSKERLDFIEKHIDKMPVLCVLPR